MAHDVSLFFPPCYVCEQFNLPAPTPYVAGSWQVTAECQPRLSIRLERDFPFLTSLGTCPLNVNRIGFQTNITRKVLPLLFWKLMPPMHMVKFLWANATEYAEREVWQQERIMLPAHLKNLTHFVREKDGDVIPLLIRTKLLLVDYLGNWIVIPIALALRSRLVLVAQSLQFKNFKTLSWVTSCTG